MRGGIYLGGGIPPKIRSLLSDGLFMDSFLDKGRFRELLTEIPIFIIMNQRTGLLGAAHCAGQGF